MTEISGKQILVTGAASGIGRLVAKKLAQKGGQLILVDINKETLAAFSDELMAEGLTAQHYVCDLADKQALQQLTKDVQQQHGDIDILINNAGVVAGKSLLDNTDDEIELMFNVNIMAYIHLTRAFLPSMMAHNSGHIVFVSSAAAICATSKLVVYSATKAAVAGFEEALRFEMRRLGCKVNTTAVLPFYIDTGMFAGVRSRFPRILPILNQDYVATRIVKAIRKNHKRVILPDIIRLTYVVKAFSINLFDSLAGFLGVNKSMDDFRGR